MRQTKSNPGKDKTGTKPSRSDLVRQLNDDFRGSFRGGRVVVTRGVAALGPEPTKSVLGMVRGFRAFTRENDPYGEHDFGAVMLQRQRVLWKIDYYDQTLEYASPDPADPHVTTRVLTIMPASEY